MRAFLLACLAAIILAGGGILALGALQKPSGVAFATDGARINPHWAWRQTFRRAWRNPPPATGPESCEVAEAYQFMFVDFGEENESDACTTSQ
jgi:hypothetical protein